MLEILLTRKIDTSYVIESNLLLTTKKTQRMCLKAYGYDADNNSALLRKLDQYLQIKN